MWTLFYCTIIIHSKKQTNWFKSIECETNPNESVRSVSQRPCRRRARPWRGTVSHPRCTNPEAWPTVWIDKRSVDISLKLPIIDQRWRQSIAIVVLVGTGVIEQNANSTRTSSEVWSDKSTHSVTDSRENTLAKTFQITRCFTSSCSFKVHKTFARMTVNKLPRLPTASVSYSSAILLFLRKKVGEKPLYCKLFHWRTACFGQLRHVPDVVNM